MLKLDKIQFTSEIIQGDRSVALRATLTISRECFSAKSHIEIGDADALNHLKQQLARSIWAEAYGDLQSLIFDVCRYARVNATVGNHFKIEQLCRELEEMMTPPKVKE